MRRALCGLVLAMGLAGRAEAQWAVDQSNLTQWINYSNPNPWLAQTFRPTANNITAFSTFMSEHGGFICGGWDPTCPQTFTVYLALYSGAPSDPVSVKLAGGTVGFSYGPSGTGRATLDLGSPIAITPGHEYWIVMGEPSSHTFSWWNHAINTYTRGAACSGGALVTDPWYCDNVEPDSGFGNDFDFETYFDPNFSTVPEPSTWALLAMGGVVASFARRRKTKA